MGGEEGRGCGGEGWGPVEGGLEEGVWSGGVGGGRERKGVDIAERTALFLFVEDIFFLIATISDHVMLFTCWMMMKQANSVQVPVYSLIELCNSTLYPVSA